PSEQLSHLRDARLSERGRQSRIVVDDRSRRIDPLRPKDLLRVPVAQGEPEDALVQLESISYRVFEAQRTGQNIPDELAGDDDRCPKLTNALFRVVDI